MVYKKNLDDKETSELPSNIVIIPLNVTPEGKKMNLLFELFCKSSIMKTFYDFSW
jgi:hypothetical protein